MRIAVEGCTHGELEKTYDTIKQIEQQDGRKVRGKAVVVATDCRHICYSYLRIINNKISSKS